MHNRTRGFRYRSNGRGRQARGGTGDKNRLRPNAFSNGRQRNNFKSYQSAEKLVEKYNALAKEALSSGDKTFSENYLQHADHFMRVIGERNQNRNLDKDNNQSVEVHKQISENSSNKPQKIDEDKK